jgi:hypothetical protein
LRSVLLILAYHAVVAGFGLAYQLEAQAPSASPIPPSSELPRFTLRQMIIGRNRSELRIPGPWLRAATSVSPESLANQAYRSAASRVGIQPLGGDVLASERSQHVMGLYRRAELVAVSESTLAAIRSVLPSDTVRARFDRIFRPRGAWIVDLHDAALAWARSRVPGVSWEAARGALARAHWLPSEHDLEPEAVPRALYGLTVLAATDSAAFAAAKASLSDADSASALAALALLTGYTQAQQWYADALEFFLRERWVPDQGGRSIQDYVRREWRDLYSPDFDAPLPRIETRWFGYPQAVPRYGVPTALFSRLVRPDNSGASEWLEHNSEADLLRALRWLPPGDTSEAVLQTPTEAIRLTTVSRQSQESLNGFLEPEDAISIDPGYSPLLALGAIVHEWQHLLFRRRQLERFAESLGSRVRPSIRLPGVQPHLAEGFAEWSSERILSWITARWPLLALGELEKRADLSQRGADDQHALGYALVRSLAAALASPARVTDVLLRHAEDPSGVLREPALRKAWSKYRGAADRSLPSAALHALIPEVTFTIDDGFPEVVETRILVPEADASNR